MDLSEKRIEPHWTTTAYPLKACLNCTAREKVLDWVVSYGRGCETCGYTGAVPDGSTFAKIAKILYYLSKAKAEYDDKAKSKQDLV